MGTLQSGWRMRRPGKRDDGCTILSICVCVRRKSGDRWATPCSAQIPSLIRWPTLKGVNPRRTIGARPSKACLRGVCARESRSMRPRGGAGRRDGDWCSSSLGAPYHHHHHHHHQGLLRHAQNTRPGENELLPELEHITLVALRENGLKASVTAALVRVPQLTALCPLSIELGCVT